MSSDKSECSLSDIDADALDSLVSTLSDGFTVVFFLELSDYVIAAIKVNKIIYLFIFRQLLVKEFIVIKFINIFSFKYASGKKDNKEKR